ncbi:MAG: hypothetical protein JO142_03245 [Burkholderiales bacterium]|nr:hypothetical protein [Burkholderiales bacterium]
MRTWLILLGAVWLTSGCSIVHRMAHPELAPKEDADKPKAPMAVEKPVTLVNGVDTSGLKLGTWSYDVAAAAKAAGCEGDGAWLITPPGPREAYRVTCSNGRSYTAVCDSMHCEKQ